MDQPVYRLTLTPTGSGPPPIIRLRSLLKAALRGYRLRCTSAVEVKSSGPVSLGDCIDDWFLALAGRLRERGDHKDAETLERLVKDWRAAD